MTAGIMPDSHARGTIAALILAGGRSRRMGGGDKTLMLLAGRPMLAHVLDALRPLPTAISANGDPIRFRRFDVPVLSDDPFLDQGPLAGVLAGLDWAAALGREALLTVPGDTPLIPTGLARALAPAPSCAMRDGQAHHLIALWPVSCRTALRAFLSSPGPRDVRRFSATIGMRMVDFEAGTWDPFANANTPDDLVRIRNLIGDRGDVIDHGENDSGDGENSRGSGEDPITNDGTEGAA